MASGPHDYDREAIERMVELRPLVHDPSRLSLDYGESEACEMVREFGDRGLGALVAVLAWPGVATRWRNFLEWVGQVAGGQGCTTPREALSGYARHLGMVRTHRALALTEGQLRAIREAGSIWPTGRLRASEEDVRRVVEEKGVTYVAVGRLYIGLGMLPVDPSLSLHDDHRTTLCIASGYQTSSKHVWLFELEVPVIETLGWTVSEVARRAGRDDGRWFEHRGVWFDSTDQTTERYVLYDIPFLSSRLLSLKEFSTFGQIEAELAPFREEQLRKKQASEGLGSAV